jgi:hypothetical protein
MLVGVVNYRHVSGFYWVTDALKMPGLRGSFQRARLVLSAACDGSSGSA